MLPPSSSVCAHHSTAKKSLRMCRNHSSEHTNIGGLHNFHAFLNENSHILNTPVHCAHRKVALNHSINTRMCTEGCPWAFVSSGCIDRWGLVTESTASPSNKRTVPGKSRKTVHTNKRCALRHTMGKLPSWHCWPGTHTVSLTLHTRRKTRLNSSRALSL